MNEYLYTERHMGTDVHLAFVCEHQAMADQIAQKSFATIRTYENIFSRFRPESELSLLNQSGEAVVSDTFLAVLNRSLELAHITHGVFNPLLQVATLGYHTTYPGLPPTTTVEENPIYNTDLNQITIQTKTNRVSLGSHQQLDFGGILKGYLAAHIADDIIKTYLACTGCIINIGGDIATRGLDAVHEPFIFLLYNPVTGIEIPVAITDASLATSGTYARVWQTNTRQNHHIVDSTSRQNPLSNLVATSITARDGALTEALTKLFLIKGADDAQRIVSSETYQYQFFTVSNTGNITKTII